VKCLSSYDDAIPYHVAAVYGSNEVFGI